ncbi:hypothetical protein [Pedobacter jeongneungensis]|uniref:hypothetical protein n=1 Tax=Pedobacter jeongneungensis TaxID=947309 RepID=UPI0004680301|nr:hypothetical protein [Pedobacter jeongneungensis]
MNKRFIIGAALSALMFGGAGASAATNSVGTYKEMKSGAIETRQQRHQRVVFQGGGLDLIEHGAPGLSPKAYGMLVGNGGSKRSNRLRYSHNAKLKRRCKN